MRSRRSAPSPLRSRVQGRTSEMSTSFKTSESQRELLVLGAYGVLGTGITDTVIADPSWRVVTAGRRPPPAHHFSEGTAPPSRPIGVRLPGALWLGGRN